MTTQQTAHRIGQVALAVLLLATLVAAPATAAGSGGSATTPAAAPSSTEPGVRDGAWQFTPGNNTTTTPENSTSGDPPIASQVRVTPIRFDEGFLSVKTKEADASFKTSGPFAIFTLSHPVDAARVIQKPASATVLGGGHQVKVEYTDDAAPLEEESLYELQLFFKDGSTKTVKLYATNTGVSVAAAKLQEYKKYIKLSKEHAKEHGYGTSAKELIAYKKWERQRADLVEGWLSEKAIQLFVLGYTAAKNPLFWVVFLAAIAAFGKWLTSKYGGVLEANEQDPGKARRKREQLETQYEQQRQSADEEPLEEVPEIGSNAIYWTDAYGVKSVAQMADLAARGLHRETGDGLEQVFGGVDELDAENIEHSWLEQVLRSGRIQTAKRALTHMRAACKRMESKYNMGHIYREPREEIEGLIHDLTKREQEIRDRRYNTSGGDD